MLSVFRKLDKLYAEIVPRFQEYGFRPPSAGVVARELSEKILVFRKPPLGRGGGVGHRRSRRPRVTVPRFALATGPPTRFAEAQDKMPVPDFQSLMLPALKALAGHREVPISDVRQHVAAAERLTTEDLREMLPSGRQSLFMNRVSWAVMYLGRAGLTARVRRGVWRVTEDGTRLLDNPPSRIDMSYLRRYPAYVAWRTGQNVPPSSSGEAVSSSLSDGSTDTPEEALEKTARQLRELLESEVLERVRQAAPEFLEKVVIDLLIAMGYGGGDARMGRVTGRSGDGGIDGMIKEDALGLDEVYVQAKKYADGNTVGDGALRNFAGAIDAAGTTKGVFVTTAGFTRAAKEYVARSPKRIVLIDGEELARLMIQHDVGVRMRVRYEIKRIDEDYFDQDAL